MILNHILNSHMINNCLMIVIIVPEMQTLFSKYKQKLYYLKKIYTSVGIQCKNFLTTGFSYGFNENEKEEQKIDFANQGEILKELDKLEDKLILLINFYEDLGVLRGKRKELVVKLSKKEKSNLQHEYTATKKQVMFDRETLKDEGRRPTKIGGHLEKKKSIAQVYELLGDLSTYHLDMNSKISKLQNLKSQNKLDPETIDIDKTLSQLQEEKEKIDDKIINFVIKNVVEGKAELFSVISGLEEDNREMEDMINFLERRVDFLKETVTALMVENQILKKGEQRGSDIIRQSIIDHVDKILPTQYRTSSGSYGYSFDISSPDDVPFSLDKDDVFSVGKTTMDSFTLDAALATWRTDEDSIQDQVKRIGKNLEMMEVNHMKLNLLKRHVAKHGAKYINRNTLIDPSKGMSLWHGK